MRNQFVDRQNIWTAAARSAHRRQGTGGSAFGELGEMAMLAPWLEHTVVHPAEAGGEIELGYWAKPESEEA